MCVKDRAELETTIREMMNKWTENIWEDIEATQHLRTMKQMEERERLQAEYERQFEEEERERNAAKGRDSWWPNPIMNDSYVF